MGAEDKLKACNNKS